MAWLMLSLFLALIVLIGLVFSKTDWGGPHVNWLDGWTRLLCRYLHGLDEGLMPLPASGPAIVVANHVSGLDPLLLIAACHRPLRFLIATEEYNRPVFHWLFRAAGCIPVDRKGRPELALRAARRALEKGEVIALFPHGKIHLDTDPPRPIKGGVARLAAWSQCDIYPVRIEGVKAQGKTFTAPFIPDHVALFFLPVINLTEANQANLELIAKAIETPT
ncbi:lysophospholipid acyltransferase family protein [Methylophaga thiooxydans]|uniref:Acyltransferase domain protein n=1 Tax=Methylophaga thiooxydans DMS010 TaxID=637616 RepID=C0N8R0_9GAMM|nr:lysophospholipid acyltransferase family protein [Methylophaga thiooxydans]EEF78876.1 Acyltransferase domain protein [Methylophaga thiooxydans DMS010]